MFLGIQIRTWIEVTIIAFLLGVIYGMYNDLQDCRTNTHEITTTFTENTYLCWKPMEPDSIFPIELDL